MPISTIGQNGLNAPVTLTSPVINTVTSAAATALTFQSAGTTAITVDTSQRVLIGTTSASYGKLVISGASADVAMQIADTASTTAGIGFNGSGSTNGVGAPTGTLYFGQYNGFPMVFTNNNAERMRISSAGVVTAPYQPAFHASKSGSPNTTSENPVQYDTVEFNTGSHYNNSTYRFTAPVAGKYFMTAQFNYYIGSGGARQIEVALKLNGGTWQSTDTFTTQTQGNNTHCSATVSAVMNLSAGDYVQGAWLSSSATVNFYSAALRNSFSGFLIG